MLPHYSGSIGRAWLQRGGVYVIANIRGGGEYGPSWHQAALMANRTKAYQDFAAVAEDLIKRGVTSPEHLGAEGGSNGGLLMGNMLTEYPQLYGAISCEVPLLDMKRYVHLSAGASWIEAPGPKTRSERSQSADRSGVRMVQRIVAKRRMKGGGWVTGRCHHPSRGG